MGSGLDPFDSPLMDSFKLSIDTYGLSLTVFESHSWLQKAFPPVYPTVLPRYGEKYRSRSYRFV